MEGRLLNYFFDDNRQNWKDDARTWAATARSTVPVNLGVHLVNFFFTGILVLAACFERPSATSLREEAVRPIYGVPEYVAYLIGRLLLMVLGGTMSSPCGQGQKKISNVLKSE